MLDRPPADAAERKKAHTLGWLAGGAVVVSFAFMVMEFLGSR
jgi:hypothetical protein